jgi:hypothetical protein
MMMMQCDVLTVKCELRRKEKCVTKLSAFDQREDGYHFNF